MSTSSAKAVIKSERTQSPKASSSKKSAVKFGSVKDARVVQRFNELDPPSRVSRVSRVRRTSGKRLFQALEESRDNRAKRIKNTGGRGPTHKQQTMLSMFQARRSLVAAAVVLIGAVIILSRVGKFL